MELLTTIPAFIFTIAVLVTFHEFGHFWVARRCGVKVLQFSVGFGPALWSRTAKDGVEYRVAAIPLGGYVKMLGEQPGEVLSPEDKAGAFKYKSVWRRIAIVAAGPVFNLILAVAVYWLLMVIGTPALKTIVGEPVAGSAAAQAGLLAGEEVLIVDGRATRSWQAMNERLLAAVVDGRESKMTVRSPAGIEREISLSLAGLSPGEDPRELFRKIGVVLPEDATIVVGDVIKGQAAEAAGMLTDDRVLAANGEPFVGPVAFSRWVEKSGGVTSELTVLRDGEEVKLTVTPTLATTDDGVSCGKLGVAYFADHDRRTVVRQGAVAAVPAAFVETWDKVRLTVSMMWRMVTGSISWRNISGPITIADYAGETARIGLHSFLGFMALVSISLAVLNSLPIPMLDGGHLLFYSIEAVVRRPVPEQIQAAGMAVGMGLIGLLMIVAITNDIARLSPEKASGDTVVCNWS